MLYIPFMEHIYVLINELASRPLLKHSTTSYLYFYLEVQTINTEEAHHAKLQINSTIADIFVPKKMRKKERRDESAIVV